ncbi:TPA: preprotein translocase subunit SecY [Candidatus Uhrbacteria bacterium]|nr:preprotein translocase subunit SecY [Candidatus Uhrbacteria bacterium]HCB18873.1 preprotein translocase subunit SecY [Candidatus Uhrbacteria bacterium]
MSTLRRLWSIRDVRNSLLFVFAILVFFRIAAHIPVPGIDSSAMSSLFSNNAFLGLLNVFSGGTLESFSVVALGVAPYITASIIFQLLAMILPRLEEMQKEESGRQKINQYTRYLTVPLALMQAYSMLLLLQRQTGASLWSDNSLFTIVLAMISMMAGTVFLMWMGELISERKVGNGTSIIIFAGIIAGLPGFLRQVFAVYDYSQLVTLILFLLVTIVTIVGVVIMNEAQRHVPVQYARQVRGSRLAGGVSSHIPLRLNMGGVIPIIFAISFILIPTTFAQFFVNARTEWLQTVAIWLTQVFQNQLVYGVTYFILVFAFSYFYTAVIFHPDRMAENLQKHGGFIPGIRPGKNTADYLKDVANRLLLAGATFISVIAVLPLVVQQFTGTSNMVIGGTSVLIVVSVVVDCVKQVESQLTMHEYEIS